MMFGGQDYGDVQGDIWEFNGKTRTWSQIPSLNVAPRRRDCGVTVYNNTLLVFGGIERTDALVSSCTSLIVPD